VISTTNVKKKPVPVNPLEGFFKQGLPKVTYSDLLGTFQERVKPLNGFNVDEYGLTHAARQRLVYNPAAVATYDQATGRYYPETPIAQSDNKHFSRPNYLEIEAKEAIKNLSLLQASIPNCASFFIPGNCGGGHSHVKMTVCGREWCPDCGKDGSYSHNRRQERWNNGKYETFGDVGYMVITIPGELRNEFKDRELLQRFRRYFLRKLKRTRIDGSSSFTLIPYQYKNRRGEMKTGMRKKYVGYENGFVRYHYAGDCKSCKGKGCDTCNYTGAGREFKPHLNILLPSGYVSKALLNKFKEDVAKWMRKEFNLSYTPKKNIYYNYASTKDPYYTEKKYHKLRYVTRATFRHYNPEIKEVLHGFRTGSSWGKFKGNEDIKTHTHAIEKGCCFKCLEQTGEISKVQWQGRLTRKEAERVLLLFDHVENGYFIRDNSPPGTG